MTESKTYETFSQYLEDVDAKPVREAAAALGIDLLPPDGQPYHCGERCRVSGGIIGPDYVRCRKCGIGMVDLLSPHVNGGYVPDKKALEAYPYGAWVPMEQDTPATSSEEN